MLRIVFSALGLVVLIASATAIDKLLISACEQGIYDQIDEAILPHLLSRTEREGIPHELIASDGGLCQTPKVEDPR